MKNKKISDLEWPIFRGARTYSGHTNGMGNIKSEPKTVAYIDMGMYDAYVSLSAVSRTTGENIVSYGAGDIAGGTPDDIDKNWGLLNYQRIEIDGEYVTVNQSQTAKYSQMFKNFNKYYFIEVSEIPYNSRQALTAIRCRFYRRIPRAGIISENAAMYAPLILTATVTAK